MVQPGRDQAAQFLAGEIKPRVGHGDAFGGKGLLIGIQLHTDQTKFIKKLMDNKLLTIRAAENVVRILPPLNVKKNEVEQALKIINKVCKELN